MRPTLLLMSTCFVVSAVVADDASGPARNERPAQASIRKLAEDMEVRLVDDSDEALRRASLRPEPLLSYGDETRNIGESALWVWMDRDQPVLLQKIEVNNWSLKYPQWTFCLGSFSETPLSISLNGEVSLPAIQTVGNVFHPVPGSPASGASPVTWPLQARDLIRSFSVDAFNGKKRSELRLMPKPLLDYRAPEQGVLYGGIFGFAAGTNPDTLVQICLRQDASGDRNWHYAILPMTSGRIVVTHNGESIAEPAVQRSYEVSTWGYFYVRRNAANPIQVPEK
ncbi:MAG: hypothetical protein ACK5Q5_10140 [Planctomycetaceae bacterium]